MTKNLDDTEPLRKWLESKHDDNGLDYLSNISAYIAELEAERTCTWTKTVMGLYGDYDNWATSCGEDFAIIEEWHERPTKFCANCGGKTIEEIFREQER